MIVVLAMVLGLSVNSTQATGDGAYTSSTRVTVFPADYPWASQYIQQELDPPRDVGDYISLSIRPFDNFLLASYYDSTNHSLMTAAPVPDHAGNCGTNNNWFCGAFDDGITDVGRYASSDFWGASLDNWKWGISYYDATNRALKVAVRACYFGDCSWTIGYVAAPNPAEDSVGMYSSFKFDSNGSAGIATTYLGGSMGLRGRSIYYQLTISLVGL